MKREIRTCDICGEEIQRGEYYQIKIRSGFFVTYQNYDSFFADRQKIDVCYECKHLFMMFVNDMKANKTVQSSDDC